MMNNDRADNIMSLVTEYGQEVKDFGYSEKAADLLLAIRVAIESPIAALERERFLASKQQAARDKLLSIAEELKGQLAILKPVAWRAWNSKWHCYDYYEIADQDPLGREDRELLGVIKK